MLPFKKLNGQISLVHILPKKCAHYKDQIINFPSRVCLIGSPFFCRVEEKVKKVNPTLSRFSELMSLLTSSGPPPSSWLLESVQQPVWTIVMIQHCLHQNKYNYCTAQNIPEYHQALNHPPNPDSSYILKLKSKIPAVSLSVQHKHHILL